MLKVGLQTLNALILGVVALCLLTLESQAQVGTAKLGGFGSSYTKVGQGTTPTVLKVADFDADGVSDFLLLSINTPGISVEYPRIYSYFPSKILAEHVYSANPLEAAEYDLAEIVNLNASPSTNNTDKLPDIVFSNSADKTVYYMRNTTSIVGVGSPGQIALDAATPINFAVAPTMRIRDLASGKFRGASSNLDVVILTDNNIYYVKNNSSGVGTISLANATGIGVSGVTSFKKMVVADVDYDGNLDIVAIATTTTNKANIFVYIGNGTGGFSVGGQVTTNLSSTNWDDVCIVVGAFFGSSTRDIAITNPAFGTNVELYKNTVGIFAYNKTINTDNGGNTEVVNKNMAVADFNGDGKQDIVVGMIGAVNPCILLGSATGNFVKSDDFIGKHTDFTGMVAVNDLDSDGDMDVIYTISTFEPTTVKNYLGVVPRYNLNLATSPQPCLQGYTIATASSYPVYESGAKLTPVLKTVQYVWTDDLDKAFTLESGNKGLINFDETKAGVLNYKLKISEPYKNILYTVTLNIPITFSTGTAPALYLKQQLNYCDVSSINLEDSVLDLNYLNEITYFTDMDTQAQVANHKSVSGGAYFLKRTSSGCTSLKKVVATNLSRPSFNAIIPGTSGVLCAGLGYEFDVTTQLPNRSYLWTLTNTLISGGNGSSVGEVVLGTKSPTALIKFYPNPASTSPKVYMVESVYSTDGTVSCSLQNEVVNTLNPTPKMPILTASSTMTSLDEVFYIRDSSGQAADYTFYVDELQSGATGQWSTWPGFLMPTSPESVLGTHYVTAEAIFGDAKNDPSACFSERSGPLTITVNAIPEAYITTAESSPKVLCDKNPVTLQTVSATNMTCQWYQFQEDKAGDKWDWVLVYTSTTNTYKVYYPGSYKVKISRGGYSSTSAAYTVTVSDGSIPEVTISSMLSDGSYSFAQSTRSITLVNEGTFVKISAPVTLSNIRWYDFANNFVASDLSIIVKIQSSSQFVLHGTDYNKCTVSETVKLLVFQDELGSSDAVFKDLLTSKLVYGLDESSSDNPKLVFKVKEMLLDAALEVVVVDRLGNIVYSSSNYGNDWEFKDSKGKFIPQGTYYYTNKVKDTTGRFQIVPGFFDILR